MELENFIKQMIDITRRDYMYTDHYNILLTPSNNLFCQTLVVMMSAIEICKKSQFLHYGK